MHHLLQIGGSVRYTDTTSLYNYGYENYSIKTIAKQNDIVEHIEVSNASKDTRNLDLIVEHDLDALIDENDEIPDPKITLNDVISAPISQNTTLGTITYTINGVDYTQNLLAANNVEPNDFLLNIFKTLLAIIILIIVVILIFSNSKKIKKNKKKRNKYRTKFN